jgi:RimJ/RimL family protein N-acetyltransferase
VAALPALELSGCGLSLVPFHQAQASALAAAADDGELWSLEVTVIPNAASVDAYIAKGLAGREQGNVLPFVVQIQESGALVGTTRFWKMDPANRKAEIGHTWFAKSWHGTFVNPAVKYLMLSYAFTHLELIRVQFQTDENNALSRSALLKLGAKEEGILRNERITPSGRHRNTARYSIIDSEWPQVKDGLMQRLRAFGIEPSFTIRAL